MIWISGMGIEGLLGCEILPNIFADHNPVILTLNKKMRTMIWRLNVRHLNGQQFIKHVKKELKEFFKTNRTPGMEMRTIWNMSKAFFRGMAIKKNTSIVKKKKEK